LTTWLPMKPLAPVIKIGAFSMIKYGDIGDKPVTTTVRCFSHHRAEAR